MNKQQRHPTHDRYWRGGHARRCPGLYALGSMPMHQRLAMAHAANGRSNKEMAVWMSIRPNTAKQNVYAAMKTLGARNRTEAVVAALRRGFIAIVGDHVVPTPLTTY